VTEILILDTAPADIETFVVGWLMPMYRTSIVRRAGDPYPFLLIRLIGSKENLEESTADPLVQVDIMCEQSLGEDAARDVKDRVHARMLQLGRYLEVDGTIDWMKVHESPRRMQPENEQIILYVARYQFGQTYD
jgi:hypothetical protein